MINLLKPKKLPKVKSLKNKAWNMFSKYIRTRDCLATTNTKYAGRCITCDKLYPIEQLQAGHFIPGRGGKVLFDEFGVHAQCYGCNIGKNGNWPAYLAKMKKMYEEEVIDEMLRTYNEVKQYKASDYIEIYETYKRKLEEL